MGSKTWETLDLKLKNIDFFRTFGGDYLDIDNRVPHIIYPS